MKKVLANFDGSQLIAEGMKDWGGYGPSRTNLHQGACPGSAKSYWAIRWEKAGTLRPAGEVFGEAELALLENAIECISILRRHNLSLDPVVLDEQIRRLKRY